ncbi:hypothetical protein pb186bvf_015436 [Paramecium bursaria]
MFNSFSYDHSVAISDEISSQSYGDPHEYECEQESDRDDSIREFDYIDANRIYNTDQVKGFIEELNCSICCHLVVNPQTCQLCEALFCKGCIQEWFRKAEKSVCPCCRATQRDVSKCPYNFSGPKLIVQDKIPKVLKTLLSKILLFCRNEHVGCQEIVTYEFRDKHETQVCSYQLIDCKNEECETQIFRKDFKEHIEECQYEPVMCKFCSELNPRFLINDHINNCDYRLVQCKWCMEKYQYCELDIHEDNCLMKRVQCEQCLQQFYLEQMKTHTPIRCLQNQLKQQKIQHDKELLRVNKEKQELWTCLIEKEIENERLRQMLKADQQEDQKESMSTNEYEPDFEKEEEDIIEEDIQIQEDDQIDQNLDLFSEQKQESRLLPFLKDDYQVPYLDYQSTLDEAITEESINQWLADLITKFA